MLAERFRLHWVVVLTVAVLSAVHIATLWRWHAWPDALVANPTLAEPASVATSVECRGRWAGERTCLYRNLYFYRGEFTALATNGSWISRARSLGDLKVQLRNKFSPEWAPRVVTFAGEEDVGAFVAAAARNGTLERVGGTALFFLRLFTKNVGHALFDTLYPPFLSAVRFGRHAADPLTLVMDDEDGDCRTGPRRHAAYVPDAGRSTGRSLRPVPVRVLDLLDLWTATIGQQVPVEELPREGVSARNLSVDASWISDARPRCGEALMSAFSGRRLLFREELRRDAEEEPRLLLRFDEVVVGAGLQGNLVAEPATLAMAGAQPPLDATAKFRDHMLRAFGASPKGGPERRGRLPRLIVVHNKRFAPQDIALLKDLVNELTANGAAHASYVDWAKAGDFAAHMRAVAETDVYVSGPGTALQYAPFLPSGSVFVALGFRRKERGRVIPSFMEQQLAGGGTPYVRALYLDAFALMNSTGEVPEQEAPYLLRGPVSALLLEALRVFAAGFPTPVPVEASLSPEGRLVRELCRLDPATCRLAYLQINLIGPAPCQADLWPEQMVYEVGGWSADTCAVNRTLLRRLRRERGLPGWGAPEEDYPEASARKEAMLWWSGPHVASYAQRGLLEVPLEFRQAPQR